MRKKILYQDIADEIKRRILSGIYPVGNLIPTETNLEEEFSVSKITIRNAVELLVGEGYLEKKSGYGTKVISNSLFNKLSKARSYSSLVKERGVLKKKVVELNTVNPVEIFKCDSGITRLSHVRRIYYLDDVPFIVFDHYLPTIDDQTQLEEIDTKSLYSILNDNGQTIDRFKDEFKAIKFSSDIGRLLNVTGQIGIQRIRKGYTISNQLAEYSIAYYNTDKVPYEIEYEI